MIYNFKEEDAYEFARFVGSPVKRHGDELRFTQYCPYCHGGTGSKRDKDTFSINLRTGQFKCLRSSCGITGNMITLARDFDFSLGLQVMEYYQPRKKYRKLKTPDNPIVPKSQAVKYLESRGISEDVANKYEITTQNDRDNVLVFPFYDEKGKMQFVKYRKTDFDKSKDKNKEWCEADCKPILFGMKQCEDFTRLVITEGQLDSLSVATAGIKNAVSVPTGAKGFTWVPYCYDWVCRFDEIVVFGDFENGHMTLLQELKQRFPNKIKHVREEDYKGCKDANELLQKHGRENVQLAVESAEFEPINCVVELADVETVDIYKLKKLDSTINECNRLLYGGIPFGGVVLITGKPGEGKSTLASQMVARAIETGHRVFAYSGELPNYLFKSWIDFQIAGPQHIIETTNRFGDVSRKISNQNQKLIDSWYRGKAFLYDNRIVDRDEKEDICSTIQRTVMQYGVDVILIDNLMTAIDLDMEKGSDKYEKQSLFVKKLARIALQFNILILLVAHKRKNNFSTVETDEISGAGDISNLATLVIGYSKDPELSNTYRRMTVPKNRLFGRVTTGGPGNGFLVMYDERSKRIYGEADDLNLEYGWINQDGFVGADEDSIPFKEKYLTDDEIEAECEKMINEFKDASGTDDDCVKLQENVQKIYELAGRTNSAKGKVLAAERQIEKIMMENKKNEEKI